MQYVIWVSQTEVELMCVWVYVACECFWGGSQLLPEGQHFLPQGSTKKHIHIPNLLYNPNPKKKVEKQ